MVFWSRDEGAVWRADGATLVRLCPGVPADPVAAAFVAGDETIEFVNGVTGEVVTADTAGDCSVTRRLAQGDSLIAAHYSGTQKQWVPLTVGTQGKWRTGLFRRGASHDPGSSSAASELNTIHFHAARNGAVLSEMNWPFAWTVVGHGGAALTSGQPFVRDTALLAGTDTSYAREMVGMGTFQVRVGFIQVLADPRTDLRMFVLYNECGDVQRRSTVPISLGVLASDVASDRVLILRRTNGLELVTYQLQADHSVTNSTTMEARCR